MPLALKPRTPRAAHSSTSLRMRSGVSVGRLPAWPGRSEVGARAQNARTDLLAAFDPAPRGHHPFRVDLAGGERRRHAVAEKHQRVRRVLVDAALAKQVDRVVRVQVEEPGQHVLVRAEPDHLRLAEIAPAERRADFEQHAVAHDDARIGHDGVAHAVEQLTAGHDDVAGLQGRGPAGRLRGQRRHRHRQKSDRRRPAPHAPENSRSCK